MTKKVNHEELREVIKKCYTIKQPLHILGGIGIGKSDSVKDTAKEIARQEKLEFTDENNINSDKYFCFIDIRVSQLEPSDLRGLPSLQDGTTKWLPPNWLPKKAKGIIFFDELQLSPPSIQASCYQLILDRRLGDYKLPEGYLVVSADNRTEDRANLFEMAKPLCNRFCHIELQTPDVEEWQEWAFKHEIDNRILAFLKFKPSNLFRFDSKVDDMAFPTPRSWEKCSNLIKDIESEDRMMSILTASAVGEGTSIEFCAFLKLERRVNIDDILKKPEKVKEIKEIDLKYALLSGLTQRYKKDKKVLDTLLRICDYLEAEFGILLWRFCYATNKSHFGKVVTEKKYDALMKKYSTYLVD